MLKLNGGLATLVVSAYEAHLHECWPGLSDKIKIEVIDNSDSKQIGFIQDLGWDNNDWLSFLYNGILLEAALNNCERCGIEKIVFFCNDEFESHSITELRGLKK